MYIPLTFEGSQAKCLFATGGYEGYFISGSQQWKYHWFTGSANLEVQKGTIDNVQIYVVGGGGAGATGTPFAGGGGGGGGAVTYTMNGRLFQGTYSASAGAGGAPVAVQSSPGLNGSSTSFIGSNITMIAGGGQGGGQGGNIGTGGAAGGSGGGVGGNGASAPCTDGAIGTLINFAGEDAAGYGCGGGGATSVFTGNDCFSCNGTSYGGAPGGSGANRYGMGGAGGNNPGYPVGGYGGSGSVMIQYPIYDYCTNYFNETGSCGCREITFDTKNDLNYYPDITGSFIYMPCGENRFVSGSLIAYAPLTVCAVSNSYFSYTIGDAIAPVVVSVQQGFVNSEWFPTGAPECVSASLVSVPCSPEAFVPTCTSSIVTIYTPSGSGGNQNDFYYVAKNATTHSVYSSTSNGVKYICISTGSLYAGNQTYPQILTGNYPSLYNTASCNTTRFSSGTVQSRFYKYYNCNGQQINAVMGGPGFADICIDTSVPYGFYGVTSATSVTVGASCLSSYFDTGSCGCP